MRYLPNVATFIFFLLTAASMCSFALLSKSLSSLIENQHKTWTPTSVAQRSLSKRVSVEVTDVISRPLFEKSRRPFQAPLSPPTSLTARPQATADSTKLDLLGIVFERNKRHAFIRYGQGLNDGQWVSEGETLEAWRVDSIQNNSVTLRSGEFVREIKMYGDRAD